MNQTARTVTGILFLIISVITISLIRINPPATTPTRSTESRMAGIMEGLLPGIIINQEIRVIKDYLSGVELILTHSGRSNNNGNTLLILDDHYKTLYREDFSSTRVNEGKLTSFVFGKPIFVGERKKIFLCLYSNDATEDNHVSPLYNRLDSIGGLYASKVLDNDLEGSVKNKVRRYRGSLMLRTYGADYSQFWWMKVFLYFLGTALSCVIIWFTQIRAALARIRILPEWVYLIIAIPASSVFAFITPPLQVPDEGAHFMRSNEIAEFRFKSKKRTAPVSILNLDSAFSRLHFLAGQKTSMAEIKKHFGEKLEPGKRAPSNPPGYTLPYIPQAIGIFTGKVFGLSPLALMYVGRIFNLLISALIMFFAIRIIPQFKWMFLLLALMPKTVFLFGSLSYDSLTISLSFMTIAVIFYYAFKCERDLNLKDLAIIAFLVLLLLFCKPPYFLLGLLFFFIPPKKIGRMYRYIMISAAVILVAGLVFKAAPLAARYINASETSLKADLTVQPDSTKNIPVIRPEDQIKLIIKDIPGYLGLITRSGFDYYRSYIVESFVGVLGWIDVDLPDALTYSYLILILFASLALSDEKVKLGLTKKSLLFLLMVATFVIVETAMYVFATRPGRDRVFGVQGRYFIPMAPLFFMLFYNRYLNPALNLLFSLRRKEYKKAKVKVKPVIYKEIVEKEQLFDKTLYICLSCYCSFALVYSIYITLIRYYNI